MPTGSLAYTPESRLLQALVGTPLHPTAKRRDYVNYAGQAKQISTITVGVFTGSADYVFSIDGIEYTMTETGGVNTTDVADQIEQFLLSKGAVRGRFAITQATNVVTLTALWPGISITVTDSDAKLTTATGTVAASAAVVPFGRAVIRTGYPTANPSANPANDGRQGCAVAAAASMAAQSRTATVADPGAGQFIAGHIKVLGADNGRDLEIDERAIWDTNLDTTLDNLATLLNAALTDRGANVYVTVAGPAGAPAAGEIAATAAIAGAEFAFDVTADDEAGYPAITYVDVGPSEATSFARAFAGVCERKTDEPMAIDLSNATNGEVTAIGANRGLDAIYEGEACVVSSESVTPGSPVFAYVGATAANRGLFFTAAATDRLPLPLSLARWFKDGRDSNQSIAFLQISAR